MVDVVGINWEGVADVFDMSVAEVKKLHRDGQDCPDCGTHLDTLGAIIQHDCTGEADA